MSRSPFVLVSAVLVILSAGPDPAARAGVLRQAAGRGGQAAVGSSIPYSVGRALPDKVGGWARGPKITMYGAANLWEYIDGAAEQYLAYEFQDLATAAYARAGGGAATVEIYRMLDAVHAYGIFAQELSPTASRVAVGVEGRAGKNSLKFWSSEFYVKITSPSVSAAPQADVLELAKAVAAGLGAPGKPPAQLSWFTRPAMAGLVQDSIKFVPADALGQSMFANAFEAKYAGTPEPSTLLIVPFANPDAARGALAKYQAFLARPGKPVRTLPKPGDGGFVAQDGYYGLVLAVRAGSFIVISAGADSESRASMLITDAADRVSGPVEAPGGRGRAR